MTIMNKLAVATFCALVCVLVVRPAASEGIKNADVAATIDKVTKVVRDNQEEEAKLISSRVNMLFYGLKTTRCLEQLSQSLTDGTATTDNIKKSLKELDDVASEIKNIQDTETDLKSKWEGMAKNVMDLKTQLTGLAA